MEYYEDTKNFSPVLNTAISLMRNRGQDYYCQLIQQGDISVVNTDYDNWNGGTYGYEVYLNLPVNVYAPLKKELIEEVEKVFGVTLNEVIKGDDNSYFRVQIAPQLTNSDIDWDIIGGVGAKDQMKEELASIKDILISVATGGPRFDDVDKRYKILHSSLFNKCKQLGIKYDNGFSSLWDWYGRYKADLPTYQLRREFINTLLKPTFEAFEDNGGSHVVMQPIVKLDEWEQINRVVFKIKRDSKVATNEEDFQQIGLLCREVIISLAQIVYNPSIHGEKDGNGIEIGKTDAVRMIGNYLNYMLPGSSNEELRTYAKATNKLANVLTHKRDATKRDMLMAVSATISLINFIGIIEDKT